MAITLVGAGVADAATGGDAKNIAPVPHASYQSGDFLLLEILGSFAMSVPTVSGWTNIVYLSTGSGSTGDCWGLWYRVATGSDGCSVTSPSTGGATDILVGWIAAWRGVDPADPIDVASASVWRATGSGHIPNIPAITPTAADGAIVVVGGKQDDWTSVATLTGDGLSWEEVAETDSTAGDDYGLVWDWAPWVGAAPTITPKTFTVSGGFADVIYGAMVALNPAAGGEEFTIGPTATFATSGLLLLAHSRDYDGVLASSGALAKAMGRTLAGTLATAGEETSVRSSTIALDGSLASSGSLSRAHSRTLAGVLTSSGALTLAKAFARTLSGTLAAAGALALSTGRNLSGTLTTLGALALGSSRARAYAGGLPLAGALSRTVSRTLPFAGTLSTAGEVSAGDRSTVNVAGTLGIVGALARVPHLLRAGTLASSGALSTATAKSFTGTLTVAGQTLIISALPMLHLLGAFSAAGTLYLRYRPNYILPPYRPGMRWPPVPSTNLWSIWDTRLHRRRDRD